MEINPKKKLRKNILTTRSSLSRQEVSTKSKIISNKIKQLIAYEKGQTIMIYLPIRNEVDVTVLIEDLWEKGKRVVIPVCDTKNINLIPTELRDLEEDLAPGTWGILEPKEDKMRPVELKDIDLVIVPGVGFDVSGNRLGYGGGYYDRFLLEIRANTPKVAVAFQLQIVATMMPDVFDIPMDMIITEEHIYQL